MVGSQNWRSGPESLMITNTVEEAKAPHYLVDFLETYQSYCVGLVDIVNSTEIAASLTKKKLSKYYEIFLNSMAEIIERFGGFVIKNIGDSLLFYFPYSSNPNRKYGFLSCIECSLKMVEEHDMINKKLQNEKLPPLDYRISADYGEVTIMKTNYSSFIDVLGTPVNMCFKINRSAKENGIAIGSDLYRTVRNFDEYHYKIINARLKGLKFMYPIYAVQRKS